MRKCKVLLLLVAAAGWPSLMAGQSSKPHSTSASGSASTNATKPLTPKSAMPSHRKAAVTLPRTNNTNTTAQLAQLERGSGNAGGVKRSSSAPAKPPVVKSASGPAEKNSGIEFKYQKPKTTAGTKGPNPNDATR